MPDAPATRRDLRVWIGLPLLYLALGIGLTWPAADRLTTQLAGDFGDGFQNLWNFWWVKEALTHFKNPFFTDQLRAPFGVTLVFQTMVWPDALFALPWWAVLPPVGVYNVVVIWSFVLTGLGGYGLVRELTGNRAVAAFAGAALMAVPFHTAHALGHQHLVAIGYLPLYLMFLHRIVKGGTRRDAVLGGLWLAAAALCSWYQLLFAAVWSLGVFALAYFESRPQLLSRAFVVRAFTLAGAFLVICGPILLAMFLAARGEPVAGAHDAHIYSADLESFFFPGQRMHWGSLTSRAGRWSGNASENGDYLGYVLLALGVYGAWKRRPARAYAATGLVGALLSMGPALHVAGQQSLDGAMPYAWLVRLIPALNFGGVPVRFGLIAQLSLVVMAGFGLAAMLESRPAWTRWLVPAVGVLTLAELWPVPLPTSIWPVPPALAEWAKSGDRFTVLDLSGDTRSLWDAMHHGKPLVGGYVTRAPRRLDDWWIDHPVFGHLDGRPAHSTLVAERDDARIDFEWGGGSPDRRIHPDGFSIHWDGFIDAPQSGKYTFYVSADDTASLSIDGKVVVATPRTFESGWHTGAMELNAGRHAVAVDYHEFGGGASVHVGWEGPGVPRQPLAAAPNDHGVPAFHGQYFDGTPGFDVDPAGAAAALRELGLRYIIVSEGDRNRLSLFSQIEGLQLAWRGDGLMILELPGATVPAK